MSNSKRSIKYWSCERKKGYTQKDAEKILAIRTARDGFGGSIYRCDYCDMWHVTKRIRKGGNNDVDDMVEKTTIKK